MVVVHKNSRHVYVDSLRVVFASLKDYMDSLTSPCQGMVFIPVAFEHHPFEELGIFEKKCISHAIDTICLRCMNESHGHILFNSPICDDVEVSDVIFRYTQTQLFNIPTLMQFVTLMDNTADALHSAFLFLQSKYGGVHANRRLQLRENKPFAWNSFDNVNNIERTVCSWKEHDATYKVIHDAATNNDKAAKATLEVKTSLAVKVKLKALHCDLELDVRTNTKRSTRRRRNQLPSTKKSPRQLFYHGDDVVYRKPRGRPPHGMFGPKRWSHTTGMWVENTQCAPETQL